MILDKIDIGQDRYWMREILDEKDTEHLIYSVYTFRHLAVNFYPATDSLFVTWLF